MPHGAAESKVVLGQSWDHYCSPVNGAAQHEGEPILKRSELTIVEFQSASIAEQSVSAKSVRFVQSEGDQLH
jgi:hypothetical protein